VKELDFMIATKLIAYFVLLSTLFSCVTSLDKQNKEDFEYTLFQIFAIGQIASHRVRDVMSPEDWASFQKLLKDSKSALQSGGANGDVGTFLNNLVQLGKFSDDPSKDIEIRSALHDAMLLFQVLVGKVEIEHGLSERQTLALIALIEGLE
jgi:hypothetical protein